MNTITLQVLPLPDDTWVLVVSNYQGSFDATERLKAKMGCRAVLVWPYAVEVLPTPTADPGAISRGNHRHKGH